MHFWHKFPRRQRSSPCSRRFGRLRGFGRGDSGFTLTELVIAMVVLGVIASIAIPSFLGSRNNSYDKEAQSSIENVLKAAKFHYQGQGDFSDASSAQCGDSTALAADLQKLEPNVDVAASSVSSTNSRIVSVQAVQTWDSTGGLLGCQGFYAVAYSSSGSCWAARIILEGKYLAAGNASPVVVNQQTNTSNNAVTTWSALAVNGHAFGVLKPQTSAADGDNTNGLIALKNACKAKTQSTGSADGSSNYIAPSQFYTSWRDVVAPVFATACAQGGTCIVGDTGPGGGTVFYVRSAGFACGPTLSATCKYLEAAPQGWIVSSYPAGQTNCGSAGGTNGTSTDDPRCVWSGNTTTEIGSTAGGQIIGTGYKNTVAIVSQSNTAGKAGTVTRAYRGPNNLDDWFLASKDELTQMCKWQRNQAWQSDATYCNNTGILNTGRNASGFSAAYYWSSSEGSADGAWLQGFFGEDPVGTNKFGQASVRPVRAFG